MANKTNHTIAKIALLSLLALTGGLSYAENSFEYTSDDAYDYSDDCSDSDNNDYIDIDTNDDTDFDFNDFNDFNDFIETENNNINHDWKTVPGAAQYKWASTGPKWDNEVMRISNLTLKEAKEIANSFPKITYFTYISGGSMYLEGDNSHSAKGFFKNGDAVFFTGQPWYGSAYGYADSYEKVAK